MNMTDKDIYFDVGVITKPNHLESVKQLEQEELEQWHLKKSQLDQQSTSRQ